MKQGMGETTMTDRADTGEAPDRRPHLTAEQARAMDPARAVEASIRVTEDAIKRAAASGKTECRVPYSAYDKQAGWTSDSQGIPCVRQGSGLLFKEHFEANGFQIRELYECRQFVDTGLIISWSSPTQTEGE